MRKLRCWEIKQFALSDLPGKKANWDREPGLAFTFHMKLLARKTEGESRMSLSFQTSPQTFHVLLISDSRNNTSWIQLSAVTDLTRVWSCSVTAVLWGFWRHHFHPRAWSSRWVGWGCPVQHPTCPPACDTPALKDSFPRQRWGPEKQTENQNLHGNFVVMSSGYDSPRTSQVVHLFFLSN